MIIGGFQKNSMIDYPGKISSVIFTSGCNFHCPYCHNPSLVKNFEIKNQIDKKVIIKFLKKRKLIIDGVVISGGEPTLQKELPDFCKEIKDIGYSVKIDTNGSKPEIIKYLIENKLIDYIAMDVKTVPELYNKYITRSFNPDNIIKSIKTIMNSSINYEFRTTCARPVVDEEILMEIVKLIKGAKLYTLQKFTMDHTILYPDLFANIKDNYSEFEIRHFQSKMAMYVEKCIVHV